MGDKGRVYKKDWDGEYRPVEGFFADPTADVKRGTFSGEPVPLRDWSGNQKRAADGSPLYEAAPDHSAEAAGGIAALVLIVALALLAVFTWLFAKLVSWWWPRVSASARKDIADRRLSWTTLAWVSPLLVIVALSVSAALKGGATPPGQPHVGFAAAPAQSVGPANSLVNPIRTATEPMTPPAPTTPRPTDVPRTHPTMGPSGFANVAGVRLSMVTPPNDCDGFAFGLLMENTNASPTTVHFRVIGDQIWGGGDVSTRCYSRITTEGDRTLARGEIDVIGFRDIGPSTKSVLEASVGNEVVVFELDHHGDQAPPLRMLSATQFATLADIRVGIAKVANKCGGFAFGLSIENLSGSKANVDYRFESDIWGGGAVSSGCYANSLIEGGIAVAAHRTTTIGFRDLGSLPTVFTVSVAEDMARWRLVH